MKLTNWSPWKEVTNLKGDIDNLFEDFFPYSISWNLDDENSFSPKIDIEETQDALIVNAELPGIDVKNVDVELEGNTLTIKGEKKFEFEEKKKNYHRIERSYGSFQRSFALGIPVKQDKLKAKYKNGVLTIHLPKAEESKEKSVKIDVEN